MVRSEVRRASRRAVFGLFSGAVLAATSLFGLKAAEAAAPYPTRPITLIVPWAAGGGTDAVARILASVMERELGQPVNVVNRTGGNGVVGHQAIAMSKPDGYTIGLLTVEINIMHHLGLTDLTYAAYRPIGLVNTDPASVQVATNGRFNTIKDVLDGVKAASPQLKFSGTGQGGIWHVAMAGMISKAGLPLANAIWVPSAGAAPAYQELAAGGLDVVVSSLPEGAAMISAGRAKSVVVMADKRLPEAPDVPTLKEATGLDWTVASVWRGIATPKGVPDDIAVKLEATLRKAFDSKEYEDFMKQRGFGRTWLPAAEFGPFMAEKDKVFGEVLKSTGLVKE